MNKDDKTVESEHAGDAEAGEIARLKGRLKEQSQLIAMLMEQAQRTRKSPSRNSVFRDEELATERNRADALDRRFNELTQKSQELIDIKNSYQEQVLHLKMTLQQRAEDQHASIGPLLSDKESQTVSLKDHITCLEHERTELLTKIGLKDYEIAGLVTRNDELQLKLAEKSADCENLFLVRQKLESYVQELRSQLAQWETSRRSKGDHRLEAILMERNDLLSRKDREINSLNEQVEEWRQRLAECIAKLHDKSAQVDADERVLELTFQTVKLEEKLQQKTNENAALKSIMEKELKRERESNSILRTAKSISEIIALQNQLA